MKILLEKKKKKGKNVEDYTKPIIKLHCTYRQKYQL